MITELTEGLRRFFTDNPQHLGLESINYQDIICEHMSPKFIGVIVGENKFIVKMNDDNEIEEIKKA